MQNIFSPADILVPKCDLSKWAVIACDQYTSEPEYWDKVKKTVGDSPSALNITLPEIYLKDDNSLSIDAINGEMSKLLKNDIFAEYKDSYIFVERLQSDNRTRYELIGKVDLEAYDYMPNTTAPIRASEKTVVERIPPRVKIREKAPLEMPHILLLAEDKDFLVMNIINNNMSSFKKLYDFDLMQNGGHIKAWLVDDKTKYEITKAFDTLYTQSEGMLFCVGDGNHSLATAKECYNKNPNEKNRYALVSVVNIFDTAIDFEPIYRVVFGASPETVINAFLSYTNGEYDGADAQKFTCVFKNGAKTISVKPLHKLPVGTLQIFLDDYLKDKKDIEIDYIHGENSLEKICQNENAVGFLFDGMKKDELFFAVRKEGSLPRKTFSMGYADDKRFYIEARKIK
ncbi:MAG: DUF1015 domain-containing protein [Clostridia bacterium]|nr:DUF1015 domain-containing protein [Clostridia bacterium]